MTYRPNSRNLGKGHAKTPSVTSKVAALGVFLSVTGWSTAWLIGDGRVALLSASLGVIGLSAILFLVASWLTPTLVVPRLAIVAQASQAVWLGLIAALGMPTTVLGTSISIDIADQPLGACAPLLLIPFSSVVAAVFLRGYCLRVPKGFLEDKAKGTPPGLNALFVLGSVAMLAFWPATMAGAGWLSYAARTMNYGLLFIGLLVGRYGRGRVVLFWWACVFANGTIALSIGARYFAFLPPVLFLGGRLLDPNRRRRGRLAVTSAILLVGLLVLSGIIGVARGRVGRPRVEDVTLDGLSEMASASAQALEGVGGDGAVGIEGVSRMVSWTNQAVTLLTPDTVPFRGLTSLWEELNQAASIAAITGQTREDLLAQGLYSAPANLYGFFVTNSNSVEFSLLADGWYRGGAWVVVLLATIIVLVAGGAELVALNVRHRWPSAALMGLLLAGKLAMDVNGLPFVAALRSFILNGSMAVLLAVLLAEASRYLSNARVTGPTRMRGAGSTAAGKPSYL
jgi:hypothetical protein